MASRRCLVAFLLIALVLPAARQAAAQTPDSMAGQAVSVIGQASIVRTAKREALRQGMTINVGDRVVTGAETRVRIRMTDGAALVVGPRSEIVVRAAGTWGRQRTVTLNLIFGIARAIAPSNHRGAVEIWTSAAIASVRHTDWIVVVRADRTAVFAVEGSVDVTNRRNNRKRVLTEGNGIDYLASGEVLGPRKWGRARVDSVLAATLPP